MLQQPACRKSLNGSEAIGRRSNSAAGHCQTQPGRLRDALTRRAQSRAFQLEHPACADRRHFPTRMRAASAAENPRQMTSPAACASPLRHHGLLHRGEAPVSKGCTSTHSGRMEFLAQVEVERLARQGPLPVAPPSFRVRAAYHELRNKCARLRPSLPRATGACPLFPTVQHLAEFAGGRS